MFDIPYQGNKTDLGNIATVDPLDGITSHK